MSVCKLDSTFHSTLVHSGKKEFLIWLKAVDAVSETLWKEYCIRQGPISFYEYLLLCTEQEELEKRCTPD